MRTATIFISGLFLILSTSLVHSQGAGSGPGATGQPGMGGPQTTTDQPGTTGQEGIGGPMGTTGQQPGQGGINTRTREGTTGGPGQEIMRQAQELGSYSYEQRQDFSQSVRDRLQNMERSDTSGQFSDQRQRIQDQLNRADEIGQQEWENYRNNIIRDVENLERGVGSPTTGSGMGR